MSPIRSNMASSSPTTRGHIRQFLEKPSWSEVFSDTINTGIYVLDPKIFSYFERDKPFDFSQELFPKMLENGDPIYGYVADGYWCDIGNLATYMQANADILQGQVNLPVPGTDIGSRVFVEEGVDIADDAQVFGPAYLGHDARIKGRRRHSWPQRGRRLYHRR